MVERPAFVLWMMITSALGRDIGTCRTIISMTRSEWYVGKGQNFTLTCSVICLKPSHGLQWVHNDTVRLQSSRMDSCPSGDCMFPLNVTEATMKDSGVYHCRTNPEVANSNNVFITVVDLVITVSDVLVEMCEGGSASLSCVASSPLDVSLFWARGGCEGNRTLSGNRTLLLTPVTAEHSGDYHCCAFINTLTPLRRSKTVKVRVLGTKRPETSIVVYYLCAKAGFFVLFLVFNLLTVFCKLGEAKS